MKELIGIKESDTGLSQPSQWDLVSDKQMMQEEQPLQVRARVCVCACLPACVRVKPRQARFLFVFPV